MNIEQLFKKDITRDIQGVIKIGQKEEENIKQELEEYVVTEELQKHFETFYDAYIKAYQSPTDRVGVWISGFFGSGKSHFLKILSYLLQSNMKIDGKRPVDYFQNKVHKATLLNKMKQTSQNQSEVVLFNIDSKAESDSKQNKTAIVKVFNKVFNEMQGYSASIPWLAELEETLDKNGEYETFQDYFKEETGLSWKEGREELYYNFDETVTALAKATNNSEESANRWLENGEDNYTISVESFAERIKAYVNQKEDHYRLIFAADEVGQYISDNTDLMLNLQTVVEDLGKYCDGKVWVLVTSQQDINSLREDISSTDFSKIQGRFNTRVSLSSANADEVIKIRLLEKKAEPHSKLLSIYEDNEVVLKNKLEFEDAATMELYKDGEDFARVYPFVPYQFHLLQKVFTGIREHGSAGKHLSDGERNLLESIQQATIQYKDHDLNTLIPFYSFYENIDQALEHSVSSTIINAEQNEKLSIFDVSVLKLLFLIRYVDEMAGTLKNLTTLMIESIDEDTLELSRKIKHSLDLLEKEFLIQRIGSKYLFLTNEEQDVNRVIGNIQIPTSEVVYEAGKRLVDEVLRIRRFTYRPFENHPEIQYLMDISEWIDERALRNSSIELGIRFLTVFSDYTEEAEIIALSQREPEKVLIQLSEEERFDDLFQFLKINQYLRTHSTKAETPIQVDIQQRKASERKQLEDTFIKHLEQAIHDSTIYVNGSVVETSGSPVKRIEQGLHSLISHIYSKMIYIKKSYEKADVERLILSQDVTMLEEYEDENNEATEEIERYLDMQKERNMMITLREVVERYKKEPYGWKELDILASLIRLIRTEKVLFTLNSKKMDPQEDHFLRSIQKQSTQEKIVVTKRKVLDAAIISKVRKLTKELFSLSSIGEKEEDIFNDLTKKFSTKQNELERFLEYYKRAPYPDRPLVLDTVNKIDRLLRIHDSRDFLTKFAEQGEQFLDNFEDLEDVQDFFKNQKVIYDKAIEQTKLYESDRNYIDNKELDHIYSEMKAILRMSRPYRKMKELKEWTERFALELTHELENVTHPIHDAIEQDKRDIEQELNQLKGQEEYQKIYREYTYRMETLEQGLISANTVKALKSFEHESGTIKMNVFQKIEDAKRKIRKRQEEKQRLAEQGAEQQETTSSTGNEEKDRESETESVVQAEPLAEEKTAIIQKNTLLQKGTTEIRSEEDVDRYVQDMRKELLNYLKESDVIKLL